MELTSKVRMSKAKADEAFDNDDFDGFEEHSYDANVNYKMLVDECSRLNISPGLAMQIQGVDVAECVIVAAMNIPGGLTIFKRRKK